MYLQYGTYVSDSEKDTQVFPFAGLDGVINNWVSYQDNEATISRSVELNNDNLEIVYPNYISSENYVPVQVSVQTDHINKLFFRLEVFSPQLLSAGNLIHSASIWQEFVFEVPSIDEIGFLTIDDKVYDLSSINL